MEASGGGSVWLLFSGRVNRTRDPMPWQPHSYPLTRSLCCVSLGRKFALQFALRNRSIEAGGFGKISLKAVRISLTLNCLFQNNNQ